MARFEKTRIHPVTAVLFLLTFYALAGAAYAAWARSTASVTIWLTVAVLATVAALIVQRYVATQRKRTP